MNGLPGWGAPAWLQVAKTGLSTLGASQELVLHPVNTSRACGCVSMACPCALPDAQAVISPSVPESLFPPSLGPEQRLQGDPKAKPKLVGLQIWRKWALPPDGAAGSEQE